MLSDTTLVVLLLFVLSGCAIILTAVACLTARDIRRTLGRVNELLPTCDQVLRDLHHTAGQAHRVLVRSHRIVHSIEDVVRVTTHAALGVIEPILSWKTRMESLFSGHDGNGQRARSEPRRHRRA